LAIIDHNAGNKGRKDALRILFSKINSEIITYCKTFQLQVDLSLYSPT